MAYRNIRLHPFLRFMYFLLRTIGWLGISIFFRRRLVLGSGNFRFDGPAIVITNHPSTLMDVFNPGTPVRQEMFFLANYGLFKHPVSNWLLTRLFCIPVKRREDVSDGQERNNASAFKQSFQHLEKNGVLFVAPEGTSWIYRWVREFKTGTARIAFGAESQNNWQLGVKIIPIGLSYNAPHLFRSDVVVNCGEAVYVRDWADAFRQSPEQAVEALTVELQRRVTALSIHCRDEAGETFISRLEEIAGNEHPRDFKSVFLKIKSLAETRLDDAGLRSATEQYFAALEKAGLSDLGVRECDTPQKGYRVFADALLLVAGLAPFLAGYLFWFLPCFLPWWLNKKLDLYIGYSSTVKIFAGLITFPLAWWAACKYLPWLTGLPLPCWSILLGTIALGYFTEWYQRVWRRTRERFRASQHKRRMPEDFSRLAASRRSLLSFL
jgi:1-acyl-sn-glycerol-3-phosphate acyltransferase